MKITDAHDLKKAAIVWETGDLQSIEQLRRDEQVRAKFKRTFTHAYAETPRREKPVSEMTFEEFAASRRRQKGVTL